MNVSSYIDNLLSFGFKQYKPNKIDNYDLLFQFQVKDKKGIKYYVNVRFWQNSKYPGCYDGFDVACQFNTRGNKQKTFNINLLSCNEMSPGEIVHWFDNIWKKLECEYYDEFIE